MEIFDLTDQIEYKKKYKLKKLYFKQFAYWRESLKGLSLGKIKIFAFLLRNTRIVESLEEVYTTKDWFDFGKKL